LRARQIQLLFAFTVEGKEREEPKKVQVNSAAPWLQEACYSENIFQIKFC